MYKHLHE